MATIRPHPAPLLVLTLAATAAFFAAGWFLVELKPETGTGRGREPTPVEGGLIASLFPLICLLNLYQWCKQAWWRAGEGGLEIGRGSRVIRTVPWEQVEDLQSFPAGVVLHEEDRRPSRLPFVTRAGAAPLMEAYRARRRSRAGAPPDEGGR